MSNQSLIKSEGMDDFTELQEVIIETLAQFHDFCEQHNLTYHLGGGTLLGAIRHKGIIPWDDDIDVDMPRPDYERFLKLAPQFPKPYKVDHFSLNDDFIYPHIKIYNKKISVTEHIGKLSYTGGAWIDVFPMDGVPENISLRKIKITIVKKTRSLLQWKCLGYQPPQNKEAQLYYIKYITKILVFSVLGFIPKKVLFFVMDKTAASQSYRSNFIGAFYSPYGVKATFPREVYEDKIKVNFNGYHFFAPKGYDYFLTSHYGDYMTPPSIDKRKGHNLSIDSA